MHHYGYCAYCSVYGPMTKEHVVPHCVGGKLTISACSNCNQSRGSSGKDSRLLTWVKAHEDVFREAVRQSTDPLKTHLWLMTEGLQKYSRTLTF